MREGEPGRGGRGGGHNTERAWEVLVCLLTHTPLDFVCCFASFFSTRRGEPAADGGVGARQSSCDLRDTSLFNAGGHIRTFWEKAAFSLYGYNSVSRAPLARSAYRWPVEAEGIFSFRIREAAAVVASSRALLACCPGSQLLRSASRQCHCPQDGPPGMQLSNHIPRAFSSSPGRLLAENTEIE